MPFFGSSWDDDLSSDDHEALGFILPRMGEDHWDALQYVEKYGLMPPQVDAAADLLEWGTIWQDGPVVVTTKLGDAVLEEQQP